MRRPLLLALAAALLAGGWSLALMLESFAAHMAAHVTAVAVAAPLLALGLAWRPRILISAAAALAACGIELVVVWGWHAPALHLAARHDGGVFALEQASFLAAGFAVWASALPSGAGPDARRPALTGVGTLLLTSMHMTLLGGLLAVIPAAWYHPGGQALADQQLGGVIMLAVGGLAYLTGALALLARAIGGRFGEGRAS